MILFLNHSKTMRCAGHVARCGEKSNVHSVLVGEPEEKGHFENLGLGRRLILTH